MDCLMAAEDTTFTLPAAAIIIVLGNSSPTQEEGESLLLIVKPLQYQQELMSCVLNFLS